jgi:hypothetical protein
LKIKATHTFEELKEAAREQHLRIEEKNGKYRVVRVLLERFKPVGVKAGTGYSLDHDELREFLISNRVDIGEVLTDWSKERSYKRNH